MSSFVRSRDRSCRSRSAGEVGSVRHAGIALLSTLLLAGLATGAGATSSVFNQEGLGRWLDGYDMAARGAGWTAIGVTAPNQMSSINPATIGWTDDPQAHVGILSQNLWIESKTSDGSDRVGHTRIPGVHLAVPIGDRYVFGLGFHDRTEGSFEIAVTENEGREDEFERIRSGSGSVGELFVTAGLQPLRDRVVVAARYGISGGTLREEDQVLFQNPPYRDTQNVLRTRVENVHALTLGVQARLPRGLSVGGFYELAAETDLESILDASSGATIRSTATLDLPSHYGVGASAELGRFRVSADWSRRDWSESEFRLGSGGDSPAGGFVGFATADRVGFGITRLPDPEQQSNDPLLARAVWRLGFTMGELSVLQRNGETVREWIVTGGIGLPIQFDNGYVDLLAEYGSRGDTEEVGLEERFVRVGLGFTFSRLEQTF